MISIAAGCGRKERERVPVVPVQGKVLVDGRPANKARIFFHAQGGSKTKLGLPFAIAAEDGTFKAGTYFADDGLPSGEYSVTVVWPLITIKDSEEIVGDDQLGLRYSTRDIPAAKVTVADTPVEMPPIELKSR
jgi:hypothetical protein